MSKHISLFRTASGTVLRLAVAVIVLALSFVAGRVDASEVDYNCKWPGRGSPWLKHVPGYSSWSPAPQTGPYYAGYFTPGGGFHLFLPVATANGLPVSTDDAYRMLCRFHPQLGGTGLRLLSNEELHGLGYDWEYVDEYTTFAPQFYTDDIPLAANEAALAKGQTIRLYWLPEIPEPILKTLRQGMTPPPETSGKPQTSEPAETRRWSVTFTGFEIDEMDPYWRMTTGVRGAVRFDYRLEAEFTTIKKKDRWTFGTGTITRATLDYSPEYEPTHTWSLKPPSCPKCDDLPIGRALGGELDQDGTILLKWGLFKPVVEIEARIVASCIPMPNCAEWGKRQFVSASFFETINITPVTLTNGWSGKFRTEPSGKSPDRVAGSINLKQLANP